MPTNEELLSIVQQLGSVHHISPFSCDVAQLRFLNLSFSLGGEDLWLKQYLKPKLKTGLPGFYVDLGSGPPEWASNTLIFYNYGWRGVCIDANKRWKETFAANRPRDVFVNAVVSAVGDHMYFAEHRGNPGRSRVAHTPDQFGPLFQPSSPVPVMSLKDILHAHVPADTEIDFMSVDIEDSELSALQSHDWLSHKPRMVMIETHGLDPAAPYDYPTISFLRTKGYVYEGTACSNALMTLREGN